MGRISAQKLDVAATPIFLHLQNKGPCWFRTVPIWVISKVSPTIWGNPWSVFRDS